MVKKKTKQVKQTKQTHGVLVFFLALTATISVTLLAIAIVCGVLPGVISTNLQTALKLITTVCAVTLADYYMLRKTGLLVERKMYLFLMLGIILGVFAAIPLSAFIDGIAVRDVCRTLGYANEVGCVYGGNDVGVVHEVLLGILYFGMYSVLRAKAEKIKA